MSGAVSSPASLSAMPLAGAAVCDHAEGTGKTDTMSALKSQMSRTSFIPGCISDTPPQVIALLQFGVAFFDVSNRHCSAATGSRRTSLHRCFNSQLHSFKTVARAVTRCWIAANARG